MNSFAGAVNKNWNNGLPMAGCYVEFYLPDSNGKYLHIILIFFWFYSLECLLSYLDM